MTLEPYNPNLITNSRILSVIDNNKSSSSQSVSEKSTAEVEAEINTIIIKLRMGKITVADAQITLTRLGITVEVTRSGPSQIIKFEYNNKSYSVHSTQRPPVALHPGPLPAITPIQMDPLDVKFYSYNDLRNYVFSGASNDFNTKYSDVKFNGPCPAAINVSNRHADDFASCTKNQILEELHDEYLYLQEGTATTDTTTDATTSNSNNNASSYSVEFLKAVCQFTDNDLARYFTPVGDTTYVITEYELNNEYIQKLFPDKKITTVQDLINNLKNAKYSYMDLMHSPMVHCMQYFTKNTDGTYSFNYEAIQAKFPDKDIRTIGQLEAAVNGTDETFKLGNINDTNNLSYSEGFLKDYGFNDEIINDYFTKDNNDKFVLNQTMLKKRFPNITIESLADLSKALKSHTAIYESRAELESYGLSEFMIENFFKENENGTYSYNIDNLKYYFVDNKIPTTLTDLKNTNLHIAFEEQLSSSCKEFDENVSGMELLKYLEAFKNATIFHWCEKGPVSYGKSDFYDKDFIEKVFDTLLANTGIDALSEEEFNEMVQRYREHLQKNQYRIIFTNGDVKRIPKYTDAQIEEMVQNYINELKKTYNVRSVILQLTDDFHDLRRGSYESTQLNQVVSYPIYYVSGNSTGDYWVGTKKDTGLTSKEILWDIFEGLHSSDYKTRFRSEMLLEKFNELGLSEDEMYYVMDIICKEYGIRKNSTYSGISNIHLELGDEPRYQGFNFLSLENSVNYNDFYNLLKVIEEKTENIRHMSSEEIQAATTIDSNALFLGKHSLGVNDFLANLNNWQLSEDPGVRKFINMIKEVFNRLGASSTDEQASFIWILIELVNNECGVKNTEPPVLTTETLNMYLSGNIFSKLENLLSELSNYSKVCNDYYIGDTYKTNKNGDIWKVTNLSTGQTMTIDFQYLLRFYKETEGTVARTELLNSLKELPIEALIDVYYEATFIYGSTEGTGGTYHSNDDTIHLNNTSPSTIIHETGHALANSDWGKYSQSKIFVDTFNEELARYIASGEKQNVNYYDDNGTLQSLNLYPNLSNYCTTNSNECFAECYAMLLMGSSYRAARIITKYFPKCLNLVKSYMKEIRNADLSVRRTN